MQKITPCLWYNFQAEEAVQLYASIFKDVKVLSKSYYTEGSPGPVGAVLTVNFELFGQEFMALNGGPEFPFTEAISLCVNCESQEEVDEYWNRLTADGGEESQCGWLKDRFGVSWQIVPVEMEKLMSDPNPEKARRVMEAMLKMKRLDIRQLQAAYDRA
jgi:predicted 3-demethylubiquinone-9 3-methyltransferase (glyoxalase superfamily)